MCHHVLGKTTTFDNEVASKHRRETGLPKFRLLALKRFILYHRFPQAGTDILDQPGLRGTLAHKGIISWTPRLGAHALVLVYTAICPSASPVCWPRGASHQHGVYKVNEEAHRRVCGCRAAHHPPRTGILSPVPL